MGSSVEDWRKAPLEVVSSPDPSSKIDWASESPRHRVKIGKFFLEKYGDSRSVEGVSKLPTVRRALTEFVKKSVVIPLAA